MLQGKHPVLHLHPFVEEALHGLCFSRAHTIMPDDPEIARFTVSSSAPNAQIDGILIKEITAFHQIRAFT